MNWFKMNALEIFILFGWYKNSSPFLDRREYLKDLMMRIEPVMVFFIWNTTKSFKW